MLYKHIYNNFETTVCQKLLAPSYICNSCSKCNTLYTLKKWIYQLVDAKKKYKEVLSETRFGISLSEQEISHLDEVISPLLKKK